MRPAHLDGGTMVQSSMSACPNPKLETRNLNSASAGMTEICVFMFLSRFTMRRLGPA
jgi:hypothetical protein